MADTRQRLASEAVGGDGGKVFEGGDLGGGVALAEDRQIFFLQASMSVDEKGQRDSCVIHLYTTAVICDL